MRGRSLHSPRDIVRRGKWPGLLGGLCKQGRGSGAAERLGGGEEALAVADDLAAGGFELVRFVLTVATEMLKTAQG